MIPSANSAGDLSTWHAENWAVHQVGVGAAYNTSVSSSSNSAVPAGGDPSRYLNLHRHQVLDWENAMLLAQHSNTTPTNNGHESVYHDQLANFNKAALQQADAVASLSQPARHNYEELLSAHCMASSTSAGTFSSSVNAWGLLNTVCSRSSGSLQQEAASLLPTEGGVQYSYEGLNGADALAGGYSSLAAAAASGLYADSLRSSGSSNIGLASFDQRRLDDIMKRELYTTHDLNSRLGLNLGGRTYFSTDDFAFGRWGKRLRPNSPGCVMQPAPLCQAEGCKADLSMAKHYHRRHKVCEYHSKAATVHIGEQTQRFCQQCSRFHVLDEFDDGKRSCRKRLADHNRRRRKPQPTPSSTQLAAAGATTTGETNGTDDQPKDLYSQEATAGRDTLQTGGICNKGSPLQSPTPDQECANPDPTASSTAAASPEGPKSMQNSFDLAKTNDHEIKVQKQDIKHHRSNTDMTIASLDTTTHILAASLSLGGHGATDMLDVKPESSHMLLHASIHDARSADAGPFTSSISVNKPAPVMPWLQGSTKKNQDIQGTRDIASERALTFQSLSSTDFKDSNGNRGSWMMKGMGGSAGEAAAGGGHELLRLLGDERDRLLTMTNKQGGGSGSGSGSIGTLAFVEHSLDPSLSFVRPAEQQLHFSDAEHQAGMTTSQLNRTFDSHSHITM